MIKIFNDTLHTIFVKNGIFQKTHFVHIQPSYTLQTYLVQAFEKLDELITRIMHAED